MNIHHQVLSFPTAYGEVRISTQLILWVQGTSEKTCLLHLSNKNLSVLQSIVEVNRLCGSPFLFCLENGIVNMSHIVQATHNGFLLDNGEHLTIPSFWVERMQTQFCQWLVEKIWEE